MKLCERRDIINNVSVNMRERKHIVSVTQIAQLFFLLFLLIKPFYLQRSGTLQIGDIFLVLSFFTYYSCHEFTIDNKDKLLAGFLLCTVLINGVYSLLLGRSLMISSLYFLFNFMVISCFRAYSKDSAFLAKIKRVFCVNIIVQVILYFTGIGDYWRSTYRYIGSYNDPNQLAFAVISAFFILCLLKEKYIVIYFIMTAFLVYKTYSTGMLFSMIIGISMYAVAFLRDFFMNRSKRIKTIHLIMILILILAILYMLVFRNGIGIVLDLSRFRIDDKLNKGSNVIGSFLEDRNMMVIVEHPLYFLFGYGEGAFNRYAGYNGELHSTMIATCYYYGIIPFGMFLIWIWKNIKNSTAKEWPVYIALIAEAFTLINHRQPTFWIIFVLGSMVVSKGKIENEIQRDRTDLQC